MKQLSKCNKTLIYAFKKGYRILSNGSLTNPHGKQLHPTKNPAGYLKFNVCKDGKGSIVYIHKLQAYQKFKDLMFKVGIQVRHLNEIKGDNRNKNIAIGTQSDNQQDTPLELRRKYSEKGRIKAIRVAAIKNRRFTDKVVTDIRKDHKKYKSYKQLMLKYNIKSKGTLYYILNNTNY